MSSRDLDAVDLEQREPQISNLFLHPQQSWRNHQQVEGAERSAKLSAELSIADGSSDGSSGYVLV
jgi:hypothetical protein